MHKNEFILDRWMVKIIRDICRERNIEIKGYSDDWILDLKYNDNKSSIYGYKFGFNDSAADAITQDKVATYQILNAAGVPAVEHAIVSTRATSHDEWMSVANEWHTFIVKPLHGGGGRGLKLFTDTTDADRYMKQHAEQSWCVSPFLPFVKETRVILLDGNVLLAFEKQQPVMQGGLPMFNLRLGAKARALHVDNELEQMARLAQDTLGLRLSAVDIAETNDGKRMVLEVNNGFSLEHYMRQSKDNLACAEQLYETLIDTLFPNVGGLEKRHG